MRSRMVPFSSILPRLKRVVRQVSGELHKQVELERGLPFAVRLPNELTAEALEQARTGQGLEGFNTLEDLFEDLGIG